MKVEQVYELVNTIALETVGESAVVQRDLSNVVDVGKAIFDQIGVDNYVKSLINHIGKVTFVNRIYNGSAPQVLMDSWEFGSVLQKIQSADLEASENEAWDLENGRTYNQDKFVGATVESKFFNSKTTFEVDISFTEMQVKESFSNAAQLNGFFSMLTNQVDKAITIGLDGLIKSTINSAMADTIHDARETGSEVRAVNLLKLYQEEAGATVNDPKAVLTEPEFIRFAVMKMKLYVSRLGEVSRLFNLGGKTRHTPHDMLNVVMLSDFKAAADVYLQSDTYNKEFTELPKADTVAYWQGSGTSYGFESNSSINVISGNGNAVQQSGILCTMFDRDALGVTNQDRRVKSHYNAKGEFFNYFHKADAGYFTDGDENMVVFYVEAVPAA